jgi:inorganic phosphate transporter, PiT family
VMTVLIRDKRLFEAPKGDTPPPLWIRGLLVLTCTGVSFAHGSNDGQKGMGLIMLILVGTVPIAYALNRAMPLEQMPHFIAVAQSTEGSLAKMAPTGATLSVEQSRASLSDYVRTKQYQPEVMTALSTLTGAVGEEVRTNGSLAGVPAAVVTNVRNDMYLSSEALRSVLKSPAVSFDAAAKKNIAAYQKEMDAATRFIPLWVKVGVAIALGLGTMVGWKRIVVTVGEKIGKAHLTYGQGAAAEVVAMLTIGAADSFGLPVSTTHVLSSGVAGTMAANHSGLQMATLRNLITAWVLTLPVAILLSGSLYWVFAHLF